MLHSFSLARFTVISIKILLSARTSAIPPATKWLAGNVERQRDRGGVGHGLQSGESEGHLVDHFKGRSGHFAYLLLTQQWAP
jgi:hypothetical protein